MSVNELSRYNKTYRELFDENRFALIGVPSSAGARRRGQELAPRRLREAGLLERLRSIGLDVQDLGDLAPVTFSPDRGNPSRQNLPLVIDVVQEVAAAVDAAVAQRARPLVVGGDCTITIGVLAALTKHVENLGLIYLDGDVDLNTPETTRTGIFDGMVLAHLLGRGAAELSRLGSRFPLLEEHQVSLFGYSPQAGGLDPVEVELLKTTRMAKYPLERIQGRVGEAAAEAVDELESEVDGLLVHFDVDVIDFDEFPAVDVPHRPGLRLREAEEALAVFLASPKAAGLVLTEFNAEQDTGGRRARELNETFQAALAGRLSSGGHGSHRATRVDPAQ